MKRWLIHFRAWLVTFPTPSNMHTVCGRAGGWGKCLLCDYHEDAEGNEIITDGFDNWWPASCPKCGMRMQVVRPGKAQCPKGCER
jgi:hypothetical protein